MNTYLIVVAKKNKKTPEIEQYLKHIFTYTWKLRATKDGETWMCVRRLPINVSDTVDAIKMFNKRIEGVIIQNITVTEACYDRKGVFDCASNNNNPGSHEMINIMMNL